MENKVKIKNLPSFLKRLKKYLGENKIHRSGISTLYKSKEELGVYVWYDKLIIIDVNKDGYFSVCWNSFFFKPDEYDDNLSFQFIKYSEEYKTQKDILYKIKGCCDNFKKIYNELNSSELYIEKKKPYFDYLESNPNKTWSDFEKYNRSEEKNALLIKLTEKYLSSFYN